MPENLGFAGGHNLVVRRALDAGATHVLLLNNDAVVDPGCLDALVRAASAPRVAAVGAKVLATDRPSHLWLAWGRVTWRAALVERVGRGAPDGPPFDRQREVEWVPGCAMLLARDAHRRRRPARRGLLRLPRGRRLVRVGARARASASSSHPTRG